MMKTNDTRKIAALLQDIEIVMLTTVDERGQLLSRPMALQRRDFDGDLWFFTRAQAGKVEEIRHDAHVNLACVRTEDHRFLSIAGIAKVSFDDAKMRELWEPALEEFFPRGVSDPDLALLKIEVESVASWTMMPLSKGTQSNVKPVGFNRAVMTARAQGLSGPAASSERRI